MRSNKRKEKADPKKAVHLKKASYSRMKATPSPPIGDKRMNQTFLEWLAEIEDFHTENGSTIDLRISF